MMNPDAGAGVASEAASGGEATTGTGGNAPVAGTGGTPTGGRAAAGGTGPGAAAGTTGGAGGTTGGRGGAGTGGAAGAGSGGCAPHQDCDGVCLAGFADCDGDQTNGCEVAVGADAQNCGSCGNVCAPANGTGVCIDERCALECDAGFGDCDGDVTNGCETTLASDTNNCGACGDVCPDSPIPYACIDGFCSGTQCKSGETMFDSCAPNFSPDGDCICQNGFWACPQVACPPCPEPVPQGGCLGGSDLVYAHVPGGAQCCTYAGICNVPAELTPYTTARECAQAWREQ